MHPTHPRHTHRNPVWRRTVKRYNCSHTANRLSQVQIGQTNPDEASKITYWHNVLGQRVFKSEPQVAQLAPNTSTFDTSFINWLKTNFGWLFAQAQTDPTLGTSYLYADGPLNETNLLGEYGNGSANSAGRSEYIWLPSQNGQAMPIAMYQNDRFYAIHADHQNTPRRVTDDGGKVVWQWSYSAFGDNPPSGILQSTAKTVTTGTGTSTINVLKATKPQVTLNLRMPGQYLDEESGQFYNYSRNYDPKGGRYTQADPIGLGGGWNRFGYVNGDPLNYVDPMGLMGGGGNHAPKPPGFILHGNWCGPSWTGGRHESFSPASDDYYKPAIDATDSACRRHDMRYYLCRKAFPCDKKQRGQCMTSMDRQLADEVRFNSDIASMAIYVWMNNNNSPDPGEDAPSCSCTTK